MRELVVYSRRGCHLCDDLLAELEPLCRDRARIVVRDVDSDTAWATAYGDAVPVLVAEDKEICRYHLDHGAVIGLLNS